MKFKNLFTKAYYKFSERYDILVLNKTLEEISLQKCFKNNYSKELLSRLLYGNFGINIELVVRQIIFSKLANVSITSRLVYLSHFFFNFSILCLPSNYLKYFKKKIKLNFQLSIIIFYIYTFTQLFKSLAVIFKLIFFHSKKLSSNSSILFGFPSQAINYKKKYFNFIKWFSINLNNQNNLVYVTSDFYGFNNSNKQMNINHIKAKDVFVRLSLKNYVIFLSWSFLALFSSILSFCFLRWWHLFLLPETIKLKYFSLINSEYVPDKFFFTLGNLVYRPMWTYYLNIISKEVIFINYGPSISGINFNKKIIHYPGFKIQTWSNRYEYSKEYVDYLKNNLNYLFKYKIFKDIDWMDSDSKINLKFQKNVVAVFDSTPFDRLEQAYRLYFNHLGNEDFCINFIKDVIEVSADLDLILIIKAKKIKDPAISKKYMNYLKNLKNKQNIYIIDSISPKHLFKISDKVISFPFTSTGILAKNNKKNVCFYKPHKFETQDKIQSLGIPIKYNKQQLKNWLKFKVIKN